MGIIKKENKRGIQISFAWLFAIIVGAFILFLAIYAVTKITDTSSEITGAKGAKEIGVLLNPLETGFEEARSVLMSVSSDTKIHNRCDETGEFGTQTIRVSQKNFGKWSETDTDVGFSNKYIFSEADVEGRSFYLFSKQFEFPFKVSDVIYMTSSSDDYCLAGAPDEIANEITELNQENLHVSDETGECSAGSIIVCFDNFIENPECDIDIRYSRGEVAKDDKTLFFVNDALMYGAVFSDAETYECQVKRLMKRASNLALLYEEKSDLLAEEGCLDIVFSSYRAAVNIQTSENLFTAFEEAERIKDENQRAGGSRCELW
jgi:hypothetical protein